VDDGLILVVIEGIALLTVKDSHVLLTLLLLVSPLYVALKVKEPRDEGVTELDAGTELLAPTVTVEVEVGVPVHAALLKKA
jgi:hypothetical protein